MAEAAVSLSDQCDDISDREHELSTTEEDSRVAFTAQWDSADTLHLAPSNLPLSRVRRAWERRPASPFTRRMGKVWKRAAAPAVRRGQEIGLGAGSPAKVVKRVCTETGYGVSARVAKWEARGSPERRIVTRRMAARDEGWSGELVELAEEEVVEGGEVEVVDESGVVIEGGDEEAGWEDVDEDAGGSDSGVEDMDVKTDTPVDSPDGHDKELDTEAVATEPEVPAAPLQAIENDECTRLDSASFALATNYLPIAGGSTVLPDGFVSPAKRRRLGQRATHGMSNDRRRTLPVQFAPAVNGSLEGETRESTVSEGLAGNDSSKTVLNALGPDSSADSALGIETLQGIAEDNGGFETANNAGRNVQELAEEQDLGAKGDGKASGSGSTTAIHTTETENTMIEAPDHATRDTISASSRPRYNALGMASPDSSAEQREDQATSTDNDGNDQHYTEGPITSVPSTPMHSTNSIEHAPTLHPLATSPLQMTLPSRRSPRRRSSSPRKPGILRRPKAETSHLVAFTPLRQPSGRLVSVIPSPARNDRSLSNLSPTHMSPNSPNTADDPPIERALSAPPDSPPRTLNPRISDDIALLHAFLTRAAERKKSALANSSRRRRSSLTARREHDDHRRESDAVRHALGSESPIKEVLSEMDVNVSSPRKAEEVVVEKAPDPEADAPQMRRSGRTTRAQVAASSAPATAAPNRITIRNGSDGVELRTRNEAQDLARATRDNTRRNKAGSILPPLRLAALTLEPPNSNAPTVEEEPARATTLRWAPVLELFHEGANEVEPGQGSEEVMAFKARVDNGELDAEDGEEVGGGTPVPARDTPSKPKASRGRKLKPAKAVAGVEAGRVEAATAAAPELASAPKARKSKIATAAKPQVLAPSTAPQPSTVTNTTTLPKKPAAAIAAPRKKLPVPVKSALPLPLSASTSAGKENATNTLLSSPAKKKPAAPAGLKMSAVPKLAFGGGNGTGNVGAGPMFGEGLGEMALGLGLGSSPAKKGRGRSAVVVDESEKGEILNLGLASPAKKRVKRS